MAARVPVTVGGGGGEWHGGRISDRSRFDKRINSSEPARGRVGGWFVYRATMQLRNRASRSGGWAAAPGGSQLLLLPVRPRRRRRIEEGAVPKARTGRHQDFTSRVRRGEVWTATQVGEP